MLINLRESTYYLIICMIKNLFYDIFICSYTNKLQNSRKDEYI